MAISNQNTALRAPTETPADTAESLGAQVIALLPPLRLHSVSVFDAKGDVQWLSEGALGPDDHEGGEEAIVQLTAANTRAHLESSLNDGRAALFLAVRTPRATLAGVVMLLMDGKQLASGNPAARVLTTGMRSVLQKIAMLLVPPPPLGATATFSGIRQFSSGTLPLEVAVVPGASVGDTANASIVSASIVTKTMGSDTLEWQPTSQPPQPKPGDAKALEILEPAEAAAEDLLVWSDLKNMESGEIELTDPVVRAPEAAQLLPQAPAAVAAVAIADSPQLRLRELVRLRAGSRTRRYQVVPVAEEQRGDALATLNLLLAWLKANPTVAQGDPLSFTIAVSAQALTDPELPAALARQLGSSPLERGAIGFELRESACVTHRSLAEKFIAQCEQSHCFAVIDDFTFHHGVLDLLRSSAVRMVKVENRLVTAALRDKLAQARVVAIAQAAKVLGTHCAAKYVDSQSGRRWLTAVGFDFTQSSATESLQRLSAPASV